VAHKNMPQPYIPNNLGVNFCTDSEGYFLSGRL
jgi:hypothetical protein